MASRLKFLIVFAALLSALIYFAATTHKLVRSELAEQRHLIEITNAFTRAFAEERSSDTVVPATFRRIGMEHFTASSGESVYSGNRAATMRMPGTPGLEIRTKEEIERIRNHISSLATDEQAVAIEESRIEDGVIVARTIMPSIASDQSCVACHNAYFGERIYQLGDIMGAFVVETNLTAQVVQNAIYAGAVFALVLFGTFYVARREESRMKDVVTALSGKLQAESQINKFLAEHDSLTGLANRRLFTERLEADVERAGTNSALDAVLVIVDLDDFKSINDTFGHAAGDELLRGVAELIKTAVEEFGGLAARLGGDEFAAILPSRMTPDAMERFATHLLAQICKPVACLGTSIEPGASIGIAVQSALNSHEPRYLLKAADVALYSAKSQGKHCYRVFDDELLEALERRSQLEEALPLAIENGDVRAILQPQVDLATGNVVGFETLARWNYAGEEIAPTEFIRIAEESGLISQLDLSVFKQAILLVQELQRSSGQTFCLSANVSTLDLRKPDFAETILDRLLEQGFNPRSLVLEITESAFLSEWSAVTEHLDALQAAGVRIAIDDFGSGYSSLSYLTQFTFDVIKLDRSFLNALNRDAKHRILLSYTIQLANALDKTVVVEGVETPEQAAIVHQFGARTAQGSLYGLDIEETALKNRYVLNRDAFPAGEQKVAGA